MTPIIAILIILLIQIIGYLILDKINLRAWKYSILGVLLIAYIFILPSYFIPDNHNNEPRCGMPALGITLVFWVLGCGTTLLAHLIYVFIRKIKEVKVHKQS